MGLVVLLPLLGISLPHAVKTTTPSLASTSSSGAPDSASPP
jgi:hypothetical protein